MEKTRYNTSLLFKKFWNIDHVIILFRIPTLNILGELEKSELVSIDDVHIYKANIAD